VGLKDPILSGHARQRSGQHPRPAQSRLAGAVEAEDGCDGLAGLPGRDFREPFARCNFVTPNGGNFVRFGGAANVLEQRRVIRGLELVLVQPDGGAESDREQAAAQ